MSDHEWESRPTTESEHALERILARYGPLMRQQEQVEAELDPVFAARLRAVLLDSRELAPHPTFARNLRSRLVRRTGARPVPNPDHMSRRRWLGISTFASAALILGMIIRMFHTGSTYTPTLTAPFPTRADLIYNFPTLPSTAHRTAPTVSLVHPGPGEAFAGRLHLTASSLPVEPSRLPAYRLALPPGTLGLGRRILHISAPIARVTVGPSTWLVAADGGGRSGRRLHSLAIATATGELVYHDRRNHVLPRATHPLNRTRTIAIARSWLTSLGWPAQRMPLQLFARVAGLPNVRRVVLGWPGIGLTALPAATLWVTPNGSVIEGWVWPPIARRGVVAAQSITTAWKDVQSGRLPLTVQGISAQSRADGTGILRRTRIVSILVATHARSAFLVPVYRFTGPAHIGASRHLTWFGFAPGTTQ